MIAGITGGIGSGKTTLSKLLREYGYAVYDTDASAREIQNSDSEVIQSIQQLFGKEIYFDGKLNRPLVASIVFNQPDKLKQLTNIVHPAVKRDFLKWKSDFKSEEIIFMESAVLFEGEFDKLVDKIILVTAPEDIRIQRIKERDGLEKDQIIARIKNQIPESLKIPKSDLIIDTTNGLPANIIQLIEVWKNRIIS
jgi:dephospho-CoA kinase